jgi:hypothetical protein
VWRHLRFIGAAPRVPWARTARCLGIRTFRSRATHLGVGVGGADVEAWGQGRGRGSASGGGGGL